MKISRTFGVFGARYLAIALVIFAPPLAHAAPIVIEESAEENFTVRGVLQRPKTSSSAAILLGYKAGAPHLALTFGANALILQRITPGKAPATIARQALTMQASAPISVQWRNGLLRAIYNDRVVLQSANLGKLAGGIALSEGSQLENLRVQPVESVHFSDDFMRSAGETDTWKSAAGDWSINFSGNPEQTANAFAYLGRGKPAIAVAGQWFWSDYTAAASVRPSKNGSVGLALLWQDAKNHLLFQWHAAGSAAWKGREKQLWRVWRGQKTLLTSASGGYAPGQWYRLSAGVQDGVLRGAIDGQTILQTRSSDFGQGPCGLFFEGQTPTIFDDVEVRDARVPIEEKPAITPQFTREQSMEEWATAGGEWISGDSPWKWHRGVFWGDHALELKANDLKAGATISAVLGADGKTAASGHQLEISAPDSNRLQAVLKWQDKVIGTPQTISLAANGACIVRLERRGKTVRATVNGRAITINDAAPLSGAHAAYSVQNASIVSEATRVTGGHVRDYTFYRAPTDWYVGSGVWEMASRWMCAPGWSWYGGKSDKTAALWNKHGFEGDFVLEAFVACQMDSPSAPYYLHPRDLNLTICGDGRDVGSGYSVVFGGWNNTVTRLLRQGKTVAETKDVLLPLNYHQDAHHKWFRLRIEKSGATISFSINGKPVFTYRDTQPLAGHRIALWTHGNGLMVARATIYFQKTSGIAPVPLETSRNTVYAPDNA